MGMFDENYGVINFKDEFNKFCSEYLNISDCFDNRRMQLYEKFKNLIRSIGTPVIRGKQRASDLKNYILLGISDFQLIGRAVVDEYMIEHRTIFENARKYYAEEGMSHINAYNIYDSTCRSDKFKNGKRDNYGFAIYTLDDEVFDMLAEAIKNELR